MYHVLPYRAVFDLHFVAGPYEGVTLHSECVDFATRDKALEYASLVGVEFTPCGMAKDVRAVRRNIRVVAKDFN